MASSKIIVIAGAHSKVGKTTLAYQLTDLLNQAVRVKVGHHPKKENGDPNYYYAGTKLSEILKQHGRAPFLVVESNRVLAEIKPDCLIFLTGSGEAKASAAKARAEADIVRGEKVSQAKQQSLVKNLGVDLAIIRKMIELAGAQDE